MLDQLQSPGAGYDILRYIGLPELLGNEKDALLYFMGKKLARKFSISSLDDLVTFFAAMGWGSLELVKEKRKEVIFYLLADAVVQRIDAKIPTEFQLESGFLAEALELIYEKVCECSYEVNNKIHQVEFHVYFTDPV
ncbi:YslB family protein [Virgibacillus sp. 179-BFC.A HS]|uniref:YslB family protein n=1 Tax=Tigheibacillus jepli TaxID=3035914 RepID=A0ABU5CHV7_9BACI|nr:YslB family protein [Virgibacillus sp. 179-BFC.A HS]MDY0405417.1 YslB family protein [Virgibacillus sp. 179-BFC.A HS]